MKVHLGCGEKYLSGYVNIDYPRSRHTVQKAAVADIECDILALSYPLHSIEEIRLHHVYEHFERPVACALIAAWSSWLTPGGILRIEVPDFRRTAVRALFLERLGPTRRAVAIRHLYGSNEAPWAVHFDGFTAASLCDRMRWFGFGSIEVKRNKWRGTSNIDVTARKARELCQGDVVMESIRGYLRNFLVDAEVEVPLLDIWCAKAAEQYQRSTRNTSPA